MTNEILQKIKSKGYWKIVIMPFEYKKERIRLGDIKQIVERSHVMKRGWPYPFTYQAGDTFASDLISNGYYSTDVDWEKHIEIWRMYEWTICSVFGTQGRLD